MAEAEEQKAAEDAMNVAIAAREQLPGRAINRQQQKAAAAEEALKRGFYWATNPHQRFW